MFDLQPGGYSEILYSHKCPCFCLPLRCSSRWSWGVPNLARLHFFWALSEAPTLYSSALCQLSYISHMWSTSAPLRTSPGPTSVGLQACFLVRNTDNEACIWKLYCYNDHGVALEFNWCVYFLIFSSSSSFQHTGEFWHCNNIPDINLSWYRPECSC